VPPAKAPRTAKATASSAQRTPATPVTSARPVSAVTPTKAAGSSARRAPAAGSADVLTVRDLNRALLARQLLLARARMTPLAAIAQLVALQAQVARPPFVGLWTRLHGFQRPELSELLHDRRVVRATFLRGTLHLAAAADFLAFRPALQPMLSASFHAIMKDRAAGLDVAAVVAFAHTRLPATFEQLRPVLAQQFRAHDERALGHAVRTHVPIVQIPTGDPWAFPASAAFAAAETWLARACGAEPSAVALVRRYLAAFGPATIKDAQRWSGIADLAPAFAALRPELRSFRDDKRRELFDLPDAPRPPPDAVAPVRLIPDFDNLVLGHDDRRRIISDEHRPSLTTKNLLVKATFLVDGFVAGTWTIERARRAATLTLTPFAPLSRPTRAALEAEAEALLAFVEPDAETRAIDVAR
jgi:winged helix DNA-binding protein